MFDEKKYHLQVIFLDSFVRYSLNVRSVCARRELLIAYGFVRNCDQIG